MTVADKIQKKVKTSLRADIVKILDQSGEHLSHAGSSGGGHFQLLVVSSSFKGKPLIDRHKMVYEAVSDLSTSIHALSMKTLTPGEWERMS